MKLHSIETGFFYADGGAMFGLIPKTQWSRFYAADTANRCRLAMRCFVAEWAGRKVLIETGVGLKQLNKQKAYRFEAVVDLSQQLDRQTGIKPSQITDVILSHLHFDHCGHATRKTETGTIIPAFPNAVYHVSTAQWERSKHPSFLDDDAYFPENMESVAQSGQLHLIDGEFCLDEQCRMEQYDGHTPGQLACYLTGEGNERYLYPGDVVPMTPHLSLSCMSAFDLNAETAGWAKAQLLQKAVDQNRILLFYHDAYTQAARIKRSGNFYKIKERVTL